MDSAAQSTIERLTIREAHRFLVFEADTRFAWALVLAGVLGFLVGLLPRLLRFLSFLAHPHHPLTLA